MSWSDDMRCLHCDGKLPLYRKITNGQFCSAAHRRAYWEEQERLAIERLHQTHDSLHAYNPPAAFESLVSQTAKSNRYYLDAEASQAGVRGQAAAPHFAIESEGERQTQAEVIARRASNSDQVAAPGFLPFSRPAFCNWNEYAWAAPEAAEWTHAELAIPVFQIAQSTAEVSIAPPVALRRNALAVIAYSLKKEDRWAERESINIEPQMAAHSLGPETPELDPAVIEAAHAKLTAAIDPIDEIEFPQPGALLLFEPSIAAAQPDPVPPSCGAIEPADPVQQAPLSPLLPESTPFKLIEAPALRVAAKTPLPAQAVAGPIETKSASGPHGIEPGPETWVIPARPHEGGSLSADAWSLPLAERLIALPKIDGQKLPENLVVPESEWVVSQGYPARLGSGIKPTWIDDDFAPASAGLQPFSLDSVDGKVIHGRSGTRQTNIAPLFETSRPLDLGALLQTSLAPASRTLPLGRGQRYQIVPSRGAFCIQKSLESVAFFEIPILPVAEHPPATEPNLAWLAPVPLSRANRFQDEQRLFQPAADQAALALLQRPAQESVLLPVARFEPAEGALEPPSKLAFFSSAARNAAGALEPKHLWAHASDFWHNAPRDLKLLVVALPILLGLALHPSLPKVRITAPASKITAQNSTSGIQQIISAQLVNVRRTLAARAGVELTEDFRSGLDGWQTRGDLATAWSFDSNGFVKPGALALYRPSLGLTDYEVQFLGLIDRKALSFVARAKDFDNYYVVKFVIVKPGPLPTIGITRYAVIDGKAESRTDRIAPIDARPDMLYRVNLDVHGDTYLLTMQGKVVDSWSEPRLNRGGIGFFAARGEESRLRWVEVTHQYDMLGRLCAYLAPYNF